jgi:hypothetical protein
MNEKLKPLVDAARSVKISDEHREIQRLSFAYGNTAIENDRITRDMVRAEAAKLATSKAHDRRR